MTRASRALRAAALATVAGPALWLAAPGGAHAHGGGLAVDITGQSFGRVEATVTWAGDGDPVDERLGATVNAVSADGRTGLGPWRLVRAAGTPTGYTTAEALPPGRWKVTIEVGHPGLGRAQEELDVSPGTPASSPPSRPGHPPGASGTAGTATGPAAGTGAAPGGATATGAGPAPGTGPAGGFTAAVTLAAGVAVATATGALLARRRARVVPGSGTARR
ncbi:hypothetical protein [Streptomyces thermolilacinus]|uniref:CopC domain-containing protein n=1 Tax=Streptomyces thermolilacinus SPC6 TaxID=1306406 RepID=A0A1D3DNM8_9ACTN|nr:hypothetical protein [Streptomyces thermolilacinus]OEJ93916.1 hypothetical protein J116_004940 [Streptomyces thermolilacinus SPC6]